MVSRALHYTAVDHAMTFRQIVKPIVPPVLWSIGSELKQRLVRSTDRLAYAPLGWQTPLPPGGDTDAFWSRYVAQERASCQALIARVRAEHPVLTSDDAILGYLTFGYVLALTARHKDKISVIDYGGKLGEYYWIAKALLAGVELEFHCKELPVVAAVGRLLSPDVIWHTDDACLDGSYDLVMFSASLPYLPDWKGILRQAAQGTRHYLFLADIPSVRGVPTCVVTQRSGRVTILHSLFNRSEIVDTVQGAGLRLLREFTMGPHAPVANAPEQPMYAGWLFGR
jgi:putative methyltransferase (TIGR04325 family)